MAGECAGLDKDVWRFVLRSYSLCLEVFSDGSCRYGSPTVSICPLSISVSSPWRCSQSVLVVLVLSPYPFVLSVSVCPFRISCSYRISRSLRISLSSPNQSFFPYQFVLSESVRSLRISCSYRISSCHDARLLRHSLASWHK